MTSIVRLTLALLVAASVASCVKTVDVPQTPAAAPVTGSWIITDAAENDGTGWYSFNPGIDGVFTFYNNGGAQYDDGYTIMQGNWNSYTQTGGYYDAYGNYYTGAHQVFEVQASSNGGGSLNLYLDDISFLNRNAFIGTYYNGKGIEKYTFSRYY
jgi:hypothetical protein